MKLISKLIRCFLMLSLLALQSTVNAEPFNSEVIFSTEEMIEESKKAVLFLYKRESTFNGVIVSPDGLVFSVSHGFKSNRTTKVKGNTYDGKRVTLDLVYDDPFSDLAIFQIRKNKKISGPFDFLEIEDDYTIRDQVILVGRMDSSAPYFTTKGRVLISDINLPDYIGGQEYLPEGFSLERGIFHSARTQKGLSGGALISNRGKLIGINALELRAGGRSSATFAISATSYFDKLDASEEPSKEALVGLENKIDFLLKGLTRYGGEILKDKQAASLLAIEIKKQSLKRRRHKTITESELIQWSWKSYLLRIKELKSNKNQV